MLEKINKYNTNKCSDGINNHNKVIIIIIIILLFLLDIMLCTDVGKHAHSSDLYFKMSISFVNKCISYCTYIYIPATLF